MKDKDLLQVWEEGRAQSTIGQSMLLLELLYPGESRENLLELTVGERDAALLYLRGQLFGALLHNTANCPACGQKIEWETPVEALQLQPLREDIAIRTFTVEHEGNTVLFRLPNTADILAVLETEGGASTADLLLNKCMLDADHPGAQAALLSVGLRNAIIGKMAQSDPQADINIAAVCPECTQQWVLHFDIVQYLWTELDSWAYRTIQDIGLLAARFGWSENDILSISRFRRGLYLSMIQG